MNRPLAEQIMLFFAEYFRVRGLGKIEIPLPTNSRGQALTDQYIRLWLDQKWSLYYRPPSSEVGFTDLMDSLSGTNSWTTYEMGIFKEATWEPTETGYWFWCSIDYNTRGLLREDEIRPETISQLLCLEEYIIMHYATDWPNPLVNDYPSWLDKEAWLRTRVEDHIVAAKSGTRILSHHDGRAYPRLMKR